MRPDPVTTPAADGADAWAVAPHRLRDLDARERAYATALLALVLVPFAVALVRAYHDGWIPSGDEANIALRAFDVFTRHAPLTGLPSTSALYGSNIATNHPGPIEFYLLAIPLRVLGSTTGPLLTAATINAAFAVVALWVVFRRLGTNAMLWAGVVMLAVIWSAGTAVLTDTLSSNMTMYSLLCTAVLAWALVDGDLALLPLAALVASYAAQQHLAAGVIVGALGVVAMGAIVVQTRRRTRAGAPRAGRRVWWWALGAVVVCWVPPVLNELVDRPGNFTEIVRFSADNTRPTMGFDSAVDQTLHAVTLPSILTKTDTSGTFFLGGVGPWRGALGIAIVLILVALVWRGRRWDRAAGRLALVALVLLVAGFVNGKNIPRSTESWRVNLYRWEWAAEFAIAVALGVVIARVAARRGGSARVPRDVVPIALLVVTALIAGAVVFVHGADDHNREAPAFALERRVTRTVMAHVDPHRPVLVVVDGFSAQLSVAPYVIYRLARAGVRVEVQQFGVPSYGTFRRYEPGSAPSAIVIASGHLDPPKEPGALLVTDHYAPARSALLADLATAAQGQHPRLAPGAAARLDRRYFPGSGAAVEHTLSQLPADPRAVLEQPLILRLILDGEIRGLSLDRSSVRRLAALPADASSVGGDEVVSVHVLTNAQLRAANFVGL